MSAVSNNNNNLDNNYTLALEMIVDDEKRTSELKEIFANPLEASQLRPLNRSFKSEFKLIQEVYEKVIEQGLEKIKEKKKAAREIKIILVSYSGLNEDQLNEKLSKQQIFNLNNNFVIWEDSYTELEELKPQVKSLKKRLQVLTQNANPPSCPLKVQNLLLPLLNNNHS